MSNRGGSRLNAGRKKGSGISSIVANAVKDRVDEILDELLKNDKIKQYAINTHNEYALFSGWIYIIKNLDNGFYKVGISQQQNINKRLSLYKSHSMDVEVIFYDRVNYVNDLENIVHESISHFEKGDWFKCDLAMLVSILQTITEHKHNGRTQE